MEKLSVGIVITVIILGFFGALFAGGYALGRFSCNKLATDTGIQTKYTVINGCLIKVNDRFIPRENWRGEYEQR